jgi:hypothetical protein
MKDGERILAEVDVAWELDKPYALSLQMVGRRLQGWVDGADLFDVEDLDHPFSAGAIGLVCDEGSVDMAGITVHPAG